MHPGDVPPGGTPLGSPAFSSVREDNPFAHLAGVAGSFKVNEKLGDWTMDQAQAELRSLAAEAGFSVKRVSEVRDPDTGERRIVASLSTY
jgi:crotonobetainyl-CoA:carnitine CoA-transferase CaiB-like acyl-CoA transferase